MDDKERVYFDPETVSLLKEILDDAWARLQPEQRATIRKTTLAEHILRSAAQGERDRERLLDLMEFTAEGVRSTDDCN